jgi:hypothetical protein
VTETGDAVPALHNPVVGALVVAALFAVPQAPFVAVVGALQATVVPPAIPTQLQVHGPIPETGDGVPALHRPLMGGLVVAALLAGPHTAESEAGGALQAAKPQVQVHGPLPVTADAVPMLHSALAGAALAGTPLAAPHIPVTGGAGQERRFEDRHRMAT